MRGEPNRSPASPRGGADIRTIDREELARKLEQGEPLRLCAHGVGRPDVGELVECHLAGDVLAAWGPQLVVTPVVAPVGAQPLALGTGSHGRGGGRVVEHHHPAAAHSLEGVGQPRLGGGLERGTRPVAGRLGQPEKVGEEARHEEGILVRCIDGHAACRRDRDGHLVLDRVVVDRRQAVRVLEDPMSRRERCVDVSPPVVVLARDVARRFPAA